jgi:hypothetical protein
MLTGFFCGNLKERDNLEDQDLCRKIILKLILNKQYGSAWKAFIWLCIGTSVGLCEHVTEHSSSIKCKEFLG